MELHWRRTLVRYNFIELLLMRRISFIFKNSFKSFFNEWENQYNDVKNILYYINSYENQGLCLHPKLMFANSTDLNQIQEDWLLFLSKLKHEVDIAYFKPYCIPVSTENYDFFIDISQPHFPFFEVHFDSNKLTWFATYISSSISELLMALPLNDFDAERFINNNTPELSDEIKKLLNDFL